MDDTRAAEFAEIVNATLKEWVTVHAPASLKVADVEMIMIEVVGGLLQAAAGMSQNMPGPVRLSGHQFEKMARLAFKQVAKATARG